MDPRPLAAALLLLAAAGCAAPVGEDGLPVGPDAATVRRNEAEAADLYARGTAYWEKEEWDDARDDYRDVFEDYPGSPLAPEAQYRAAECAWRAGRFYAAGELFTKYVEDRPLSPHIREVEKRLYDTGVRLIEDGRRGLWGLGIFTTSEEGVQVLRKLATLLSTGDYADDALYTIAKWYLEDKDYVGAETSLDELLKEHPSSEWRLAGRFLLAWAYRRDNRGPAYDGEKLKRARAEFLAFAHAAGRDPATAEEYRDMIRIAKEEAAAIDADMARKALLRARFYDRTGKPAAALAVLREAARQWGGTGPGKECAAKAGALEARLGVPPEPAPAPKPPPEAPK